MLCDRLKILLKELNISQRQFAMKIDLDPAYFSRILKGTATPPKRILLLIESVFNVNKQWLEEGKGEIFSNHGLSLAKKQILETIETLSDEQIQVVSAFIKYIFEEQERQSKIKETLQSPEARRSNKKAAPGAGEAADEQEDAE